MQAPIRSTLTVSDSPPDSDADDQEIGRVTSILESIAKNYADGSDESNALRDAALAFITVQQHQGLRKAYAKYSAAIGGELTEEMKDDLRRYGIDPDELDEDDP
jgi:hypothetical protein